MNRTSAVTLFPNAKEKSLSQGIFPSHSHVQLVWETGRGYSEGGDVGLEGPLIQMYSQYCNQKLEKTAGTTAPLFWITGDTVSVGVLEKTGALWSEDWALHQEKRCKWVSFGNGVPG